MNQDTFNEPYMEYPYSFMDRSNLISHPLDELEEKMNKILDQLDECLAFAVKVTPELISNYENDTNEIMLARRYLHSWVERLNNMKLKDYYTFNEEAPLAMDGYDIADFDIEPSMNYPSYTDDTGKPHSVDSISPIKDNHVYGSNTTVC